ncbi:MAG: hypothetical protein IJS50_03345 [Desulfovibrio sp.]|nr:hypothetical protein [Desulfovibrio sp.]
MKFGFKKYLATFCFLLCLGFLLSQTESWAQNKANSDEPLEYSLSNAEPETNSPMPRPYVVLEDGELVDPWLVQPEGWILSDDGNLLTEEGVIVHRDGRVEYPFGPLPKGYVTRPDGSILTPTGLVLKKPEQNKPRPKLATYPKGAQLLPDGRIVDPKGQVLKEVKESKANANFIEPKPRLKQENIVQPKEKQAPRVQVAEPKPMLPVETPVKPSGARPLEARPELWSMLPLSEVPGQAKPKEQAKEGPKPKPEAKEKVARQAKEEPKKPKEEQPKSAEPTPKKERPQPQPKEKPRPRIGEALSIPPQAARTGNLDFLEGCWQGTRPEYYSKRTITECFCFGKGGQGGKRRVIDPSYRRRCVGATQARLDQRGVLFVQSEGAVCSDGERWGQAQMTCRGQGKQTPCSWVFKDANGGQQSYAIPFVRVESCGRRR